MKTIMLLFLVSVGMLAQVAPPLPSPVQAVNKEFLNHCKEGNHFLKKIDQIPSIREEFAVLVFQLEYNLILELEKRTKEEISLLKPARECVKKLVEDSWIYFTQTKGKSGLSLRKKELLKKTDWQ